MPFRNHFSFPYLYLLTNFQKNLGFEPRISRSRSPNRFHSPPRESYRPDYARSPPRRSFDDNRSSQDRFGRPSSSYRSLERDHIQPPYRSPDRRSFSPTGNRPYRSRSPAPRSSPPQNRQNTAVSNWWNHNPKTTVQGMIKEYIDEFTGLMEIQLNGEHLTAFFHATSVWLVNVDGNPYGEPIKFSDKIGKNTATTREDRNVQLIKEMPIGSEVLARVSPVQSEVVQFVVLFTWPYSTEYPPFPNVETEQKILEKKHEYYLKEFHNKLESKPRVDATFPGCLASLYPDVEATIYTIQADENFGTVEIKGTRPKPFRFFALFHRDDVWLRDGKKGITVDFFKNKPLSQMCKVGQPVNLIARSIVVTKGADLAPAIMELQAVVVSLNPERIPQEASKPTW